MNKKLERVVKWLFASRYLMTNVLLTRTVGNGPKNQYLLPDHLEMGQTNGNRENYSPKKAKTYFTFEASKFRREKNGLT